MGSGCLSAYTSTPGAAERRGTLGQGQCENVPVARQKIVSPEHSVRPRMTALCAVGRPSGCWKGAALGKQGGLGRWEAPGACADAASRRRAPGSWAGTAGLSSGPPWVSGAGPSGVCMWGAYADTVRWELSGVRGARAGAATDLLNVECFHLKDQVFNRPPGHFRRRKLLKVTENRRGIEPGPGEAPTITELFYK